MWPLLLSIYPQDTDASLLTGIVLTHAKLAELGVSAAAAVSAPLELLRFDDVQDVQVDDTPLDVQDVQVDDTPLIPPIDEDAPGFQSPIFLAITLTTTMGLLSSPSSNMHR